jgi:hypothetical protein
MKISSATLILCLLANAAAAQTPRPPVTGEPETVYSDAQREKDNQLSRRFVQSLLRPSDSLEGQFARWKKPICPHIAGMAPAAAFVIERRIREIAQRIGAPLDRRDPCKTNIAIFVTAEPQTTIDAIIANDRMRLLTTAPHRDLQMHYPVQVWYANYYRDDDGLLRLDLPRGSAYAWTDDFPPIVVTPDSPKPLEGDAKADLTRLFTGMQPEMGDATVLVDFNAIKGMTLATLGDYIALLTLAQTPATGRCQPAPSIANLFLKDCEADFHTTALSDADMAMLTALYQTPDEPEKLQEMRLIANMRKNLEGERK